ncbi:IclR family transcriptional regulator [Microbacterium sp. HMWF026]|uniref:IclR family transcriptional regulator n=1 Tax=Microbacterium sp. HMWF026 TaxID=2056861 RepID=UPI0011B1F007|nr:helix-turn-helix domain-containing protein [Microbacterium sp. HMWF026]
MSSSGSPTMRSQTLGRALDALQVLADGRPRSSHELAEALSIPRSNAYRILRTFEDYAFVTRTTDGRYTIGLGLAAFADAGLREGEVRIEEVLTELANETSSTAILCIPQRDDVVVLSSVRPAAYSASVAIRRGTRLPAADGAPGMAILSLGPAEPYEADEITLARSRGVVHTKGSPFAGFESVAAPVRIRDGQLASVAIVFPHATRPLADSVEALRRAVQRLGRTFDVWTD